jgi:hypothetical protein
MDTIKEKVFIYLHLKNRNIMPVYDRYLPTSPTPTVDASTQGEGVILSNPYDETTKVLQRSPTPFDPFLNFPKYQSTPPSSLDPSVLNNSVPSPTSRTPRTAPTGSAVPPVPIDKSTKTGTEAPGTMQDAKVNPDAMDALKDAVNPFEAPTLVAPAAKKCPVPRWGQMTIIAGIMAGLLWISKFWKK